MLLAAKDIGILSPKADDFSNLIKAYQRKIKAQLKNLKNFIYN